MNLFRRAWAKTVWEKGAVPDKDGRIASDVRRGLLPMFDIALILAAVLALRGGMPTFEIVYGPAIAGTAAWVLLAASVLCFVALSLPKLWWVEAVSRLVMFTVLFGYAVAILLFAIEDPERGYTGGVMLAACILPVWRLFWIGRGRASRGTD